MRFGITRIALGNHAFIEITEDRFDEIVSAQQFVIHVIGIEEKYDVLLENFQDYESALLEAAVEHMCFPGAIAEALQKMPVKINRKLANLLSSARSYIDQIPKQIQDIFGKDSLAAKGIKNNFSNKYDSVLGYRAMEALRNYAQHRALPIQRVELGMRWIGDEPDEQLRFSSSIYLEPKRLEEDGKFKKVVLEELKGLGEKIEIKRLVREYIGALSDIHHEVREVCKDLKLRSEAIILQALEDFKSDSSDQSVVGVGVVVENDDLTWGRKVHLPNNALERLAYFSNKNRQLTLLGKYHVSSMAN